MTETDWLTCRYSYDMLDHIALVASPRKLRLFACACCRRLWHQLPDESRHVVVIAERHIDGQAPREDLLTAIRSAPQGRKKSGAHWNSVQLKPFAQAQRTALTFKSENPIENAWDAARESMTLLESDQCDIIRDIFGNPFRETPEFAASPEVRSLAFDIYNHSQFDLLPKLGSALEAAGCEDEPLLAHCHADLDHVRGCWVVDHVVGFV